MVTQNALKSGVNNPKVDMYTSESKRGPVTITGPKRGEFIVASKSREWIQ